MLTPLCTQLRLERTPLVQAFFSRENAMWLQQQMRYEVYRYTAKVLPLQSENELLRMMMAVHEMYAQEYCEAAAIKAEVLRLDGLLLGYAVPQLVSAVLTQLAYERDLSLAQRARDLPQLPEATMVFPSVGGYADVLHRQKS